MSDACSVCGQIGLHRHSSAVDHVSFEFEGITVAGVGVIGVGFHCEFNSSLGSIYAEHRLVLSIRSTKVSPNPT